MEERRIVPKKKQEQIPTDEGNVTKIDKKEFFSLILGAKLTGHILHLQCDEFAEHIALDEFYKGQQKNADKIIEVYQGCTKEIVQYDTVTLIFGIDYHGRCLDYLSELKSAICNNRYDIVPRELTNVHNEIDNFISTLDQTIYKITFLK